MKSKKKNDSDMHFLSRNNTFFAEKYFAIDYQ